MFYVMFNLCYYLEDRPNQVRLNWETIIPDWLTGSKISANGPITAGCLQKRHTPAAAGKSKKSQPYCLLNKLYTNSVRILVFARILS